MRAQVLVVAALLLLPVACGRQPAPPGEPVVLWRSGPPAPLFPLPPEAAWAPTYQRLRCTLEERTGTGFRWTCFAGGGFETVLGFYAARFGVRPGAVKVARRPAAAYVATVRAVAAELGHPVPERRPREATIRIVQLGPSHRLPLVQLESPWLDLSTGRLRQGTLISMRWRPQEEAP